MKPFSLFSMAARRALFIASLAAVAGLAFAHESKVGDVTVQHAYATPTPAGVSNGSLYFRAIKNAGAKPDRLVGARTPAARAVEIHHMQMDANNVMRMRAVDAIDLPAGAEVKLMHGGEWHLMLLDLKAPLKTGDRFPVTLRFERAGEVEAMAVVQQPREKGVPDAAHAH